MEQLVILNAIVVGTLVVLAVAVIFSLGWVAEFLMTHHVHLVVTPHA